MDGFCCLTCYNSDKKRKSEIDGVHMIRCKKKHAYVNIANYCDDYDYDYDVKIYEIIKEIQNEENLD